LSSYDTSGVTEMNELFKDASSFNFDISAWDTSNVTSMWRMFYGARSFNKPLSSWNVSRVTDFTQMFRGAENFNGDISRWNTASATDMSYMFYIARSFNQPIGSWDVSSVSNMRAMFDMDWYYSANFNQPLNSWNVAHVTDMSSMFRSSTRFNQDLNAWNVRAVVDFSSMFSNANAFNGDITSWDVSGAGTAQTGTTEDGGYEYCSNGSMNSMFSAAIAFNRDIRAWQIGANVGVSNMLRGTRFAQSFKCPSDAHGPPSACYVTPFSTDYALEQAVDACFDEAFDGDCECFSKCGEAGLPISKWNTTGIMYMQYLFDGRELFNQDLSAWDTTRVTRMDKMFRNAKAFNRDVSSWSVDNVFDMSNMFEGAITFSRNVSGWNIANGAQVTDMFKNATAFVSRFTCDDANDGPPGTCVETAYPSSLVHRLDFSTEDGVETTGDSVVTGFVDAQGIATDIQVVGAPTYVKNVQAGLNAINFTSDGIYLQFTASGGSQPEVFIVYRVLTYKSGGLIFSHATGMSGSYGVGTYQQGQADRIGMAASRGGSFAGADAPYDSWHVANVYFGSSDGFLNIDDGASVTTFATSGQYTADALTNVQIGGAVFGGHDVPNLIGEVLIFDEKLSDETRKWFTRSLMNKWGL